MHAVLLERNDGMMTATSELLGTKEGAQGQLSSSAETLPISVSVNASRCHSDLMHPPVGEVCHHEGHALGQQDRQEQDARMKIEIEDGSIDGQSEARRVRTRRRGQRVRP